jgi:hypothetical protein
MDGDFDPSAKAAELAHLAWRFNTTPIAARPVPPRRSRIRRLASALPLSLFPSVSIYSPVAMGQRSSISPPPCHSRHLFSAPVPCSLRLTPPRWATRARHFSSGSRR